MAVTFSVAQVMASGNVALAHRLAPYDGRITALLAVTLANQATSPVDRRRSDALAREALRRDPIAVPALAALGINADARGDNFGARHFFNYAQTLSRRDLTTQLWALEDAVSRGDVTSVLRHYDIALRVFPEMREALFPILASASVGPEIRAELTRTLAQKPLWGSDFISFLARKSPDPRSTSQLFLGLRRMGVTVPRSADAAVIDALLADNRIDEAWAYYARMHPGANRRQSRNPHFTEIIDTPSQLDWKAFSDDGIVTSIQKGVVDFLAPAGIGGNLLQQIQFLPSGRYRLIGHSSGIDQTVRAQPYWSLTCKDGAEFGRIDLPNSAENGGVFTGVFSVPSGCPVQILKLTARPSDAITGLSGQIDRAMLSPVEQP